MFFLSSGRMRIAVLMALLALCVVAFGGVRNANFVSWDDNINIYQNPHFNPPAVERLVFFWQGSYQGTHRPLTYSLWGLIALGSQRAKPVEEPGLGLVALRAQPFHTFNLLLHLANTGLVFAFLLGRTRQRDLTSSWLLACFVGALWFGLHPVQVEAVAWITGFNDLLAAFFALLALNFYFGEPVLKRRWFSLFFVLSSVCYFLALLSKPSVMTLPLGVLMLNLLSSAQGTSEVSRRICSKQSTIWDYRLLLWIALTVPIFLLTRSEGLAPNEATTLWWQRPFVALDALGFYLLQLVKPWPLSIDYGRTPALALSQLHWWMWFLPALVFWGAWRLRDPERGLWIGLAIFGLALLPVLGLVPFRFQSLSTVADRYLYLPMFGISIALACGGELVMRHLSRRTLGVLAIPGALVAGLFISLCRIRVSDWQNTPTLMNATLSVNPNSWMANNNMANFLARQGLDGAEPYYLRAIALREIWADPHNNYGAFLYERGRFSEALPQLQRATVLNPQNASPHINLANLLIATGKPNEAVPQLEMALQNDPANAVAHHDLALQMVRQQRWEPAIKHYLQALHTNPNWAQAHYNLGVALGRIENWDGAVEQWQEALRLDPSLAPAHANLGSIYLTRGENERARYHLQKALELDPSLQPIRQLLNQLER